MLQHQRFMDCWSSMVQAVSLTDRYGIGGAATVTQVSLIQQYWVTDCSSGVLERSYKFSRKILLDINSVTWKPASVYCAWCITQKSIAANSWFSFISSQAHAFKTKTQYCQAKVKSSQEKSQEKSQEEREKTWLRWLYCHYTTTHPPPPPKTFQTLPEVL